MRQMVLVCDDSCDPFSPSLCSVFAPTAAALCNMVGDGTQTNWVNWSHAVVFYQLLSYCSRNNLTLFSTLQPPKCLNASFTGLNLKV